MIRMLKKELKLTASPLSYFFLAFALMAVIPQYPILVGAFFVCFGIFHTFQKAREANDTLYSCLLPVKKTDIVKSKYVFTIFIQALALILSGLFVLLRLLVLNNVMPFSQNDLMNANLAYLGYYLIILALFNTIFLGNFFKTAYKIGVPFLIFCISAFLTVGVGEALHFIPGLEVLNENFHWSQLIVFFVGLIAYVVGTVLSLEISKKNFEKIDL